MPWGLLQNKWADGLISCLLVNWNDLTLNFFLWDSSHLKRGLLNHENIIKNKDIISFPPLPTLFVFFGVLARFGDFVLSLVKP